ncbi:MAPEG family protein [Albimonas sp. CAU 1670]|uniref:MAPEG family protein n=1 Tax=Albimonas sp. CAU 1670 TaxID=3032599 RepID=UPI0023DC4084|nr:MAPEG family protein [Albimonas sp. CAU 1670]MDF2231730.1 MAPEG family protein [Albimonas sp. CAU 1670]
MDLLSLENPVFVVYVVAAALTVLKVMGQGWMTVHRMVKTNAGLVSPEDLLPGPLNKAPDPSQLAVDEYVDRSRRMHRNDLENIPAFWAAGLLFVAVDPPLWLAQGLMGGFVLARAAHFWAYATKRRHEVRATFYTIGSLIVIYMAVHALWVALG